MARKPTKKQEAAKAEDVAEAEAALEAAQAEDASEIVVEKAVEQVEAYGDANTRVTDVGVADPDPKV